MDSTTWRSSSESLASNDATGFALPPTTSLSPPPARPTTSNSRTRLRFQKLWVVIIGQMHLNLVASHHVSVASNDAEDLLRPPTTSPSRPTMLTTSHHVSLPPRLRRVQRRLTMHNAQRRSMPNDAEVPHHVSPLKSSLSSGGTAR